MSVNYLNCIKWQQTIVNNVIDTTNALHIALVSDINYSKYVGVALQSVAINNPNTPLYFHLFFDDIHDNDIEKYQSLTHLENSRITIYYIDNSFFKDFPQIGYFGLATYYRLIIPSVVYANTQAHKVLYMDADMICLNPIKSLFEIEMGNNIACVVPDCLLNKAISYSKLISSFGWDNSHQYFNAGMMLIHTQNWHKADIDNKFIDLMQAYAKNPSKCPDQDILNILLQDKVIFVGEKYNWQHWREMPQALTDFSDEIVIAHLLGDKKPWSFAGRHKIYDVYFLNSPWGEYLPPKPEDDATLHRLYADYLLNNNADKSLIKKHRHIYYLKKLGLFKPS